MLFGVHGVCSAPKWSKDGLTHGRWFMMDLHIGDSLLTGCLVIFPRALEFSWQHG
jgi:hypothetical protein